MSALLAKLTATRETSLHEERESRASISEASDRAPSEGSSSATMNRGIALLKRRMSNWKTGGKRGFRSSIQKTIPEHLKMENTYKLGPDEGTVFMPYKAKSIIEKCLRDYLQDLSYDPKICARMCQKLTEEIKRKLKQQTTFQRYKYVVYVAVGQKHDQTFEMGSRCLWDDQKDNSATGVFQNSSLFAVGTVFATYYE